DAAAGVVGIEINANHIRSIKAGLVTATGTLLHKGRKTHVWDIKVTDQDDRLISVCRLTNMILPK
ncbi:MAG TPA: PaaI family thioesterase, partial [Cryomorphaceae bacterium]|nr:PaaI family thioesterase [Cryomorphaceae bacterium]